MCGPGRPERPPGSYLLFLLLSIELHLAISSISMIGKALCKSVLTRALHAAGCQCTEGVQHHHTGCPSDAVPRLRAHRLSWISKRPVVFGHSVSWFPKAAGATSTLWPPVCMPERSTMLHVLARAHMQAQARLPCCSIMDDEHSLPEPDLHAALARRACPSRPLAIRPVASSLRSGDCPFRTYVLLHACWANTCTRKCRS